MSFSSFVKTAMLLVCLCAAGTADAARFMYTGGHGLDAAAVSSFGDSYFTFTPNDAGWATALSGGYGSFDAIVVGEGSGRDYGPVLSASTKSSIAAYVSGGGHVIVVNDHYGNVDFFNSVFGYMTVAAYGCISDDSVGSTKTAAATGTRYAAGPAQLHNLSCTAALNTASLPAGAVTYYAGAGTSQVVYFKYGAGQLEWLGYDFYASVNPTYKSDWYTVLGKTLLPAFTTCAAEGYVGAKLTLCKLICEVKQPPSTLAGLLRLYKAIYRSTPNCPAAR